MHMQKWHYLFFALASPNTSKAQAMVGEDITATYEHFAKLGQHGWELVAVEQGYAIFKRPKPKRPKPAVHH
jgi:hypothetical protein